MSNRGDERLRTLQGRSMRTFTYTIVLNTLIVTTASLSRVWQRCHMSFISFQCPGRGVCLSVVSKWRVEFKMWLERVWREFLFSKLKIFEAQKKGDQYIMVEKKDMIQFHLYKLGQLKVILAMEGIAPLLQWQPSMHWTLNLRGVHLWMESAFLFIFHQTQKRLQEFWCMLVFCTMQRMVFDSYTLNFEWLNLLNA